VLCDHEVQAYEVYKRSEKLLLRFKTPPTQMVTAVKNQLEANVYKVLGREMAYRAGSADSSSSKLTALAAALAEPDAKTRLESYVNPIKALQQLEDLSSSLEQTLNPSQPSSSTTYSTPSQTAASSAPSTSALSVSASGSHDKDTFLKQRRGLPNFGNTCWSSSIVQVYCFL
jgi:hypothetical protein